MPRLAMQWHTTKKGKEPASGRLEWEAMQLDAESNAVFQGRNRDDSVQNRRTRWCCAMSSEPAQNRCFIPQPAESIPQPAAYRARYPCGRSDEARCPLIYSGGPAEQVTLAHLIDCISAGLRLHYHLKHASERAPSHASPLVCA